MNSASDGSTPLAAPGTGKLGAGRTHRLFADLTIRGAAKFLLALFSIPAAIALYTAGNVTGVGAWICPPCFGFERLAAGIYVEAQAPPAYRAELLAWVRAGKANIRRFFGSQQSDPTIFACATLACYGRAEKRGGRTLGISFMDWVVILSPQINNEAGVTHELTHVEFHNRLGPKMFAVPAWFDEGLAVNVSNDARYLAAVGSKDRCLVEASGPLPATMINWVRATEGTNRPYADAACLVSRWLARNGGSTAVLHLIAQIDAGSSFAAVYR